MPIKVIEQTTAERREETRRLYLQCKPYLDKGWSLAKAAKEIKGSPPNNRHGWYRDLIEYAETHSDYDHRSRLFHRGEQLSSKSCLNCKHCYDNSICVLLDDLIIGYCFMHQYRKGEDNDNNNRN